MPSRWGRRKDLPGYDEFRTGLTYHDVYVMLNASEKHRYRHRASVLGFWHELKLQFYEQAVNMGYGDRQEDE
jgi:hypothetical protein